MGSRRQAPIDRALASIRPPVPSQLLTEVAATSGTRPSLRSYGDVRQRDPQVGARVRACVRLATTAERRTFETGRPDRGAIARRRAAMRYQPP